MRVEAVTWLSPQAGGAWKRLDMRMQPTDDNPRKVRLYVTYSLACLRLARLLAHLLTHLRTCLPRWVCTRPPRPTHPSNCGRCCSATTEAAHCSPPPYRARYTYYGDS